MSDSPTDLDNPDANDQCILSNSGPLPFPLGQHLVARIVRTRELRGVPWPQAVEDAARLTGLTVEEVKEMWAVDTCGLNDPDDEKILRRVPPASAPPETP